MINSLHHFLVFIPFIGFRRELGSDPGVVGVVVGLFELSRLDCLHVDHSTAFYIENVFLEYQFNYNRFQLNPVSTYSSDFLLYGDFLPNRQFSNTDPIRFFAQFLFFPRLCPEISKSKVRIGIRRLFCNPSLYLQDVFINMCSIVFLIT